MPIYEYRCGFCERQFEVRQGFNDDPITNCHECGAGVQRVIQTAGIVFKGSGWYATESRRASKHSLGSDAQEQSNDGDHSDSQGESSSSSDASSSSSSPESSSKDSSKEPATTSPSTTSTAPSTSDSGSH